MSLHFTDDDRMLRLPKLPFILIARFVSRKAECVLHFLHILAETNSGFPIFRAKIKEAGGVVKLIA